MTKPLEAEANIHSLDKELTRLWACSIGMQGNTPDPVFDMVRDDLAELRQKIEPHIARLEMAADDARCSKRVGE